MTAPAVQRPAAGSPAAAVWELVRRAQAGDAAAFGLIYQRYRPMVFRYVYFRCRGRQLAEDLTSDTFERALRRIGSFRWQGRDLGAWLITIARNLLADHFKSGRYRLEITVEGPSIGEYRSAAGRASKEIDPADEACTAEARRALDAGMRALTPMQQQVMELRWWAGLSVAETAEKMGINESACKALSYRAIRMLARREDLQALWPGRAGAARR